jgi:hypothetical protein
MSSSCLANCHRQKLTLDNNVEIQKQGAFKEAEEPQPESDGRAMTVLRFNEWFGLTEASLKA